MIDDEDFELGESVTRYDQYFHDARSVLTALFEGDKEAVYYTRQLEVMHEKRFYHWITNSALKSITGSVVKRIVKDLSADGHALTAHFYTHRLNRYPMRKINALENLIRGFSHSMITRSCGNRAEILFSSALAGRGFTHQGPGVNEYRGIKWIETGHDLDYIFEKDGRTYGCEIKNTLPYIERIELDVKLRMCAHLELIPLFIMRWAPVTYNREIIERGGFALLFESQIYELSQADLVNRIREAFGQKKADCPARIPEGIIDRFVNWHNRYVNSKNNSPEA